MVSEIELRQDFSCHHPPTHPPLVKTIPAQPLKAVEEKLEALLTEFDIVRFKVLSENIFSEIFTQVFFKYLSSGAFQPSDN